MSLLLNYDVTAVENAVNPSKFNKGKITIESLNAFKKFLDGLQPDQVVSIVGDLFDCFDTPSGDKAPYPLSEQYEDNKVTSIQDEDGKELQVLSPNKTRLTEHFYMLCDLFDLIQQYPEIYFIFHTGYYHTNWKGLKDTKNFVVMAGIKSFAKHYSKIRMVGKDENKEKLLDAKKSFIEDGTYFNLRDNVPNAYFCVTVHNISWIKATMYGFIMNHYGQFDPLVANRCVHIVFSNRLFELKSKVRMCTRVGRYNPTNPSEVLQEAIWEDFRFSDLFDWCILSANEKTKNPIKTKLLSKQVQMLNSNKIPVWVDCLGRNFAKNDEESQKRINWILELCENKPDNLPPDQILLLQHLQSGSNSSVFPDGIERQMPYEFQAEPATNQ